MIAACYECGVAQRINEPTDDCPNCGERVGVQCSGCSTWAVSDDLDQDRRCEDCAASAAYVAKVEKLRADFEAWGDYVRDQMKDGAR